MFENIAVRPDVYDKPLLDWKEMYKLNCKFVTFYRQQNSNKQIALYCFVALLLHAQTRVIKWSKHVFGM